SEIEESIESHRVGGSQRGSKISEKRSGDFAYRAKGDNAKPIAKDFPKDTIRRPDEAGLKERRDD
ncbi:MAG: hypothetical protein Q8P49_03935, partial [Candidatus Liptonbacteria bacterium]|nr:hypothetical protein [Candidatus Liptonbacteria bacterium]